jgi:hypothetical protein
MKRKVKVFWLVMLLLAPFLSFGQKTEHFYNVDKEIRVEGKIQKIVMESRYKDTAPFLIVLLEEKNTKKVYTVEISPVWFFDQDFHQGEHLSVVGSLTSSGKNGMNIIAREVQLRGDTLVLRDKHGFPTWRGSKGLSTRKGRRKGKRF